MENENPIIEQEEIEDKELFGAYFDKSKQYYLEKWESLFIEDKKTQFNPYAFFFGFIWMAYRKMYLQVVILYFLTGLLEELLIWQFPKYTVNGLRFIISTFVGFSANYLYLQQAKRQVKKAKIKFESQEERIEYLNKKGGISYIALVIAIIILFLGILLEYSEL